MSTPQEELIMQAIEARMNLIKTDNQYANDVRSVQRFEMGGNDFVDMPLILLQLGEVERVERCYPNVKERATVMVSAWVRHDKEADSRSTDALLISLDGDIYNAVMMDRLLGGLAKDAWRMSVAADVTEDAHGQIVHAVHVSEFAFEFTHPHEQAANA